MFIQVSYLIKRNGIIYYFVVIRKFNQSNPGIPLNPFLIFEEQVDTTYIPSCTFAFGV